MEEIISFLQYFGVTKESITPIALVVGIAFVLQWQFLLKKMVSNVEVLRNASAEIQSFLKKKHGSEFPCLHEIKTNKS